MVALLAQLLACYGVYLLATRVRARKGGSAVVPHPGVLPKVSVIIPARNEELNIGRLLSSLVNQEYGDFEVVVVDDHSRDRTADIARSFGVKVLSAPAKPNDWNGKQWACWHGAQEASGEILIFTDADTNHLPGSLRRAVCEALASKADMLSALPYHRTERWWEKLLGPFHLMLLSVTRPLGRPARGRVFAIGQYLLYQRAFYERVDGHRAVKQELVEDLPLANLAIELGGEYWVYAGEPLYEVRMYKSLTEFIQGWRRNFRAGFAYGTPIQSLDMVAMFAALGSVYSLEALSLAIGAAALACVARRQRQLGAFSVLGAVAAPYALASLGFVTALALWDRLLSKPVQWKGRALNAPSNQNA